VLEVYLDELRLVDVDENSGYAADPEEGLLGGWAGYSGVC